jgi:hypothetical protein
MNISKQAVLEIIESVEMDLSNRCYDGIVKQINSLPSISDGWISVANVPLNVEVILLDTMTGDVTNCTYIRQPDKPALINRFYWMPKPPTPPQK